MTIWLLILEIWLLNFQDCPTKVASILLFYTAQLKCQLTFHYMSITKISIQINDLISFFKVSIFNTCFCQSKKPKPKFCSCDDLTNFFFDGLFSISYTPYSFELTQLIVHGNFGFIRIQKCVESYYKELIQKIRWKAQIINITEIFKLKLKKLNGKISAHNSM